MIVCLCHGVSDRDIARAVRGGTACFETLQDDTRVASSCGSCLDCAREVFDQCQDEQVRAAGACAAVIKIAVAATS